jgi:hypothetical protein
MSNLQFITLCTKSQTESSGVQQSTITKVIMKENYMLLIDESNVWIQSFLNALEVYISFLFIINFVTMENYSGLVH